MAGDERKSVLRFPRAILADEPTTGLDAFQALRVVELLKELASSRSSVLCLFVLFALLFSRLVLLCFLIICLPFSVCFPVMWCFLISL